MATPEGWEEARLGDVFDVQLGKMLSPKAKTGLHAKPYLGNTHVQWGRFVLTNLPTMDFAPTEEARFRLRSGDLLMCEGGEVGRCAIWRDEIEECYYQKALHRLRPRDGRMVVPFAAHWFQHQFRVLKTFERDHGKTTIAHLPKERLEGLELAVPPVGEQRKIAAILSSIDDTIEKTEAVIAQLEVVKKAMMQELLTRGMPGRHTRFKRTEIGEIPEGWDVQSIGELLASGPTNGIYKPADQIGRGALLMGMTAIVDDAIDWSLSRRAAVTSTELQRFGLEANDVLVRRVYARVEGVGRAVLVPSPPEPAVYESNMMRLRFDETRVLAPFACRGFALRSVREQVEGAAQLAAQASINSEALRSIKMAIPSVEEQREVNAVLAGIESRSQGETVALRSLGHLKRASASTLLSGDLRVTPAEAPP